VDLVSSKRISRVLLLSACVAAGAGCAVGSDGDMQDGSDGTDREAPALVDGSHDSVGASDTGDPGDTGGMTMDSPTFDAGSKREGGDVDTGRDAARDAHRDAVGESGGDAHRESGTVPTTCAEADHAIGCCDGNVLYYCDPTLKKKTCTGGEVCGWDTSSSFYDCVSPPGHADPMGTYPLACR
jgi:hypothetical protein